MMSCWPGDKTASVMTSWTTKVLNSRRRRRRFLEFRSFASAATAVVAAYACGTAKGQGRTKTKHRTRHGLRPVCERLAGRGSRVRELRRLYATDENVSNE